MNKKEKKELKRIGKKIKEIRELKEMTQEQLAKESGLKVLTISRLENEHRDPAYSTLCKLIKALEIEIKELF